MIYQKNYSSIECLQLVLEGIELMGWKEQGEVVAIANVETRYRGVDGVEQDKVVAIAKVAYEGECLQCQATYNQKGK